MAKPKQSKKQHHQVYINEIDDIKADEMRELMNLSFRVNSKFKNKKQREMSDTIMNNRITFVTGTAGTGKSYIALKTGLELLKSDTYRIGDILLTTPIVEVSPKSIGALPGLLEDKVVHYFQHFYDNLSKLVDKNTLDFLRRSGLIGDKIVNFIRGATFGKLDENGNPIGTFCVLDEAQNLSVMELKTYISRLGENSKMVILGDIEQCDLQLKRGDKNALEDAIERFKNMDGVGLIQFTEDDIVRDKFLIEIMKRYKDKE